MNIDEFAYIVRMFENIATRTPTTFSFHDEGYAVIVKFSDAKAEDLDTWITDAELTNILYELAQHGFRTIIRASVSNSLIFNIFKTDETEKDSDKNVDMDEAKEVTEKDDNFMYR